jgi:hypothetical protein
VKNSLCTLLLLFSLQIVFADPKNVPARVPARTIKDLRGFPKEILRGEISRPLYRSIEVSPIEAWIVARAAIYSAHTANAKIIHSEANGVYDKMALELANSYTTSGNNEIESRAQSDTLNVHLLVFNIRDGKMAICFAISDDPRYQGYQQTGDAWIGILQNGQWKTVSKPRDRRADR